MAKCPRKNCKNEAESHVRFGLIPCKSCRSKDAVIKEAPEFATLTMQDRIYSQRDKFLGDIAQPWDERGKPNPIFIKANPDAVHDYYSDEELKQL